MASLVVSGVAAAFTSEWTGARGTTDGINTVFVNPGYKGLNLPSEYDPSSVPTFEEIIAHEVGFHNMMRKRHAKDSNGKAVYPKTKTLESNQPNKVMPTLENTKDILNTALQNNNLNDPNSILKPVTPVETPASTSTSTPESPLPINLNTLPRN